MGRPKGSPNKAAKRKMKDPNKPKRAQSAYFLYMAAMREEYNKQGKATNKVAEFTKEISVKWKALSPGEKKPYEQKAAVDKARYDREMANYKGGKPPKDANKPKKPQSAYFCFLGEFRKKMAGRGVDHKEMLKMAGHEWNKLDPKDKKPYEEMADKEKEKYEKAMKDYAAGGSAPKRAKVEVAKNGADDDDEEDDEDEEDEEDEDDEEEDDDE